MAEKIVLTVQQYGCIVNHLGELMQQKGITRGALSRQTGVRFEVIDKWAKGKVERMDLDVLARICHALDCRVADILEYKEKRAARTFKNEWIIRIPRPSDRGILLRRVQALR